MKIEFFHIVQRKVGYKRKIIALDDDRFYITISLLVGSIYIEATTAI